MRKHVATMALAAVIALAMAAGATEVRAADSFTVQVMQIKATGSAGPRDKEIGEGLSGFSKQLRAYPYKTYTKAGWKAFHLAPGASASYPLVEKGFTLEIIPSAVDTGGFIPLAVVIKNSRGKVILRTGLRLKDGGTSLVVKEMDREPGGLILAITVRKR
jgi:hypothetical protein